MKEIKAIIRSSKLWDVTEKLQQIEGFPGVSVSEVKGFGRQRAKNAKDKIMYERVAVIPRIKLEVVVNDDMADAVVDLIQKYAQTGYTGDGKIYVYPVEEVVRIRTNERGPGAL
ncbi:MAG TPA: P-II family nitrogen regulator [Spirochaetota bacterium]|nr:P-II family nitrogen regulator [Spirochaetota bacterium]HPC43005.1 P-II family nitrogen regulator [Spirochaetota bacterium]HPL16992.1 P-II family nitrogen regulator [Spirochaetota bacterium]HQF10396.1 P-II family nitrogen regulator [Spirochaetota bacterium]HQH99269.1 P-II family nitrogen regulator [Spirochaetota bacterium]